MGASRTPCLGSMLTGCSAAVSSMPGLLNQRGAAGAVQAAAQRRHLTASNPPSSPRCEPLTMPPGARGPLPGARGPPSPLPAPLPRPAGAAGASAALLNCCTAPGAARSSCCTQGSALLPTLPSCEDMAPPRGGRGRAAVHEEMESVDVRASNAIRPGLWAQAGTSRAAPVASPPRPPVPKHLTPVQGSALLASPVTHIWGFAVCITLATIAS